MTREEAIEILEQMKSTFQKDEWMKKDIMALEMAIGTMKMKPCEDVISRREAINKVQCLELETAYDNEKVEEMLRELSPVQPQGFVHIDNIYRLISGHSNYHGNSILAALTCLAEGKEVLNPITVLSIQPEQR